MAEPTLDAVCARLRIGRADLGPVAQVSDPDADRLAGLIDAAIERRDQELRDAVDAALGGIPRPLRRVVARVVGR